MRCDEFLRILDGRPGVGLPDDSEWFDHGRTCPGCALALRMERSLSEAPVWDPPPSLAPERRSKVLAEARLRTLYIPSPLRLFEESTVTALGITGLAVAGVLFLSKVSDENLPAGVKTWLLPALEPVLTTLQSAFSVFSPLASHPAGAGFLLVTAFAVSLAAVFSLRVLSPRPLA